MFTWIGPCDLQKHRYMESLWLQLYNFCHGSGVNRKTHRSRYERAVLLYNGQKVLNWFEFINKQTKSLNKLDSVSHSRENSSPPSIQQKSPNGQTIKTNSQSLLTLFFKYKQERKTEKITREEKITSIETE